MSDEWNIPPWEVEQECSATWFHWWVTRREILADLEERRRRKLDRKAGFE